MQKQHKYAAKAALRDFRPYLFAGCMALMLLILAATQATAQQKGSSASGLLIDAVDTCGSLVDAGTAAEADLIADGWTIDDAYEYGPYSWEISASNLSDDATEAYIFAIIETYPSTELGFCTIDVYGLGGAIDLNEVTDTYEAAGNVAQDEFGDWHGSWELLDGDSIFLVLAHYEVENDYLLVQMNRIGNAGGMSTTPVK